jgi:hypothetical protein
MHTCAGWSHQKAIELDRVQRARPFQGESNDRMGTLFAPFPVEIMFEKGSFVLPTYTADEQKWLIWEINDFLQSAR